MLLSLCIGAAVCVHLINPSVSGHQNCWTYISVVRKPGVEDQRIINVTQSFDLIDSFITASNLLDYLINSTEQTETWHRQKESVLLAK